jgi:hypothetical protein
MPRYYWLVSGGAFLILGLCAAIFWDMNFAAWLWGALGGFKLTLYVLAELED